MSEIISNNITDDELTEVVGGTRITEDVEKGSKEKKPDSKELPIKCRVKTCGKIFYISSKGAKLVYCPYCKSVYDVTAL